MKGPIRILHVFGRLDRGGAETMVMNLYRNIDRNNVQFDFIIHTEDKCDYEDEIKLLGGKIYRIPRYTGKNHFQYKKVWNAFFQNHSEYKIIHGHVRSTAAIYLRIAKKYGLITIAHSHSTSSGIGFSAIIKNILQYPVRYIADYLFACSNESGEWLFGKKACRNDNFFILNNAIDVKKFEFNEHTRARKRKELQIEKKFVIGHVGRFIKAKNHVFLIDIFKAVHDRNKDSVLLIVGDGELRQSIAKKVTEIGLNDSVIFTGIRNDIPELLQVMDVFVFPSLFEGLPVTLIEAQASGLPCVVSHTITREVMITPFIQFVSLKKSEDEWADIIYSMKYIKRECAHQYITNSGFNITDTSHKLTDFYLEKWQVMQHE